MLTVFAKKRGCFATRKRAVAKKEAPPSHRAHIYYSGRVQGVGFRHCVEMTAHKIGVFGWVKNLRDGRVEAVCEGSKDRVDAFLEAVRASEVGRFIQKADCSWEPPTGSFADFTVEFQY